MPGWAKSPDVGVKMINARAETVHDKPSYRRAFVSRRCLLPADGYYEWTTGKEERRLEEKGRRKRPRKQPYFVTPQDGSDMAFAGLWEVWGRGEDRLYTCTVVTAPAVVPGDASSASFLGGC